MRRLLFLVLMLLTYYLAGMYRYLPLMALCGIELILAAVSIPLSHRFCRALHPAFSQKSETAQAEATFPCIIRVAYSGRLPTGRFRVRLRTGYPTEKKQSVFQFSGKCAHGGQDFEFRFTAPYCGLLQIQLERLRAYDYFSLFFFQKRLSETMQVAVFPKRFAAKIDLSAWDGAGGQSTEERTISRPGDAHYEIRQIREYRPGDSMRHIHWNLSAKTDQLWLKEYERETDSTAHMVLDIISLAGPNIVEHSSFYTLVSALTLGFLKNAAAVRLYWFDIEKRGWETALVGNPDQCRDALLRLYQTGIPRIDPLDWIEQKVQLLPPCVENAFRLNLGLTWYFRDTKLFQFSSKTLERDIQERNFVL